MSLLLSFCDGALLLTDVPLSIADRQYAGRHPLHGRTLLRLLRSLVTHTVSTRGGVCHSSNVELSTRHGCQAKVTEQAVWEGEEGERDGPRVRPVASSRAGCLEDEQALWETTAVGR